jgi:glycosyltransferase involved in cell wall biosynthesis
MNVAFFVHGVHESDLQRAEFYWQDLQALAALGHVVTPVTRRSQLIMRADVVFCWWWTYAWLAELGSNPRGIPVVVTGVFDLPTFRQRPIHQRALMAAGAKLAAHNLFVSKFECDGVARLFGLRDASYGPLAVDVAKYKPDPTVRPADDEVRLVVVCWKRLANIRRKLIPELIEAVGLLVPELPTVRLTIAGPPEDGEQTLRALVDELGLRKYVAFRGELTREEKIDLIRRAHLYVQTSIYEGFGLAAAEAMACGTPVLASTAPPVVEVLGELGNYVDDLTPAGIAKGVIETLGSSALSRKTVAGVDHIRRSFSTERRKADIGAVLRSI